MVMITAQYKSSGMRETSQTGEDLKRKIRLLAETEIDACENCDNSQRNMFVVVRTFATGIQENEEENAS